MIHNPKLNNFKRAFKIHFCKEVLGSSITKKAFSQKFCISKVFVYLYSTKFSCLRSDNRRTNYRDTNIIISSEATLYQGMLYGTMS